jgi:recombination protein RecT
MALQIILIKIGKIMSNYNSLSIQLKDGSPLLGALASTLPKHVSAQNVARTFLNTLKFNTAIAACTEASLIQALLKASELGLPIDGRLASLIPFKGKATLIIGYQGMIQLTYQSGEISSYNALDVRENDVFDIDYGSENPLTFKPLLRGDRGNVIGFISIARFARGGISFEYMTKNECMEIGKKHSPTFNSSHSPWKSHPDQMCKKTVIRQHAKFLPMSVQALDRIDTDGHVLDMNDYVPPVDVDIDSEFTPEVKTAPQAEKIIPVVEQKQEQVKPQQAVTKQATEILLEDEIPEQDILVEKANKIIAKFQICGSETEVNNQLIGQTIVDISDELPGLYEEILAAADKRIEELKVAG